MKSIRIVKIKIYIFHIDDANELFLIFNTSIQNPGVFKQDLKLQGKFQRCPKFLPDFWGIFWLGGFYGF